MTSPPDAGTGNAELDALINEFEHAISSFTTGIMGRGEARGHKAALISAIAAVVKERDRLSGLINNPHTNDFLEAVRTEAAHQRERWGASGNEGKEDSDWFWLLGYLAGKAVSKPEKQLHHIITTAAACLNWHAMRAGADSSMRPGIDAAISAGKQGEGDG